MDMRAGHFGQCDITADCQRFSLGDFGFGLLDLGQGVGFRADVLLTMLVGLRHHVHPLSASLKAYLKKSMSKELRYHLP